MIISLKLIFAVTIMIVTLAAGLLPLVKHQHHLFFKKLDAIVSGVFLGTAFFHLLPDAAKLMQPDTAHYIFALPYLLCALAFLLLWGLGQIQLPWIIFLILSIHSIIGGLTLGLIHVSSMLWVLFIAIIAHKAFDSFALISVLYKNKVSLLLTVWLVIAFSFMTPVGILLGSANYQPLLGTQVNFVTGCFNALAAGTFVYIGFSEGILYHWLASKKRMSSIELGLLLSGFLMMAVLALWI